MRGATLLASLMRALRNDTVITVPDCQFFVGNGVPPINI